MMSGQVLVGVISDTHGYFDPSIPRCFQGVSHILHAGDIGSMEVHAQLLKIAPVNAVSGNVDLGRLPESFKTQQVVELYGVRIWLVHILGNPHRLPQSVEKRILGIRPHIVVFGHSHQPLNERIGPILFFNPGSAGPKRFHLPRCLGLLEIEAGQVKTKLIDLQ